jgi:hypothetical protein
MFFTRNPTQFYRKNNSQIIRFAASISYYKNNDEIRELVQSFYLNLLLRKSLKKYNRKSGLTFSCYIFNLVKWTASNGYHQIKKIPASNIDNFDVPTNEDLDEKLVIEENVKQYLDWIQANYPERLTQIKRYIIKRNEGYPTMEIPNYALHHATVTEYLNKSQP